MNVAKWRRHFIRSLRIYPIVLLALLGITYLLGGLSGPLGGLSGNSGSLISQRVVTWGSYFLIAGIPILAIIGFIIIGKAGDTEFIKSRSNQNKFNYQDAFELPMEEMHGYKLAFLTGRPPMFTGVTGDTYRAEASATCTLNAEHTPPVPKCECGFYAYKDIRDAVFELSINPGAFLLDVDLYGIGFVYQRGYRAETQIVNHLAIPKRCMRCKTLPAKVFVTTIKLGQADFVWWQWQVRCLVCSSSFKASDKLSIDQMAKQLMIALS